MQLAPDILRATSESGLTDLVWSMAVDDVNTWLRVVWFVDLPIGKLYNQLNHGGSTEDQNPEAPLSAMRTRMDTAQQHDHDLSALQVEAVGYTE